MGGLNVSQAPLTQECCLPSLRECKSAAMLMVAAKLAWSPGTVYAAGCLSVKQGPPGASCPASCYSWLLAGSLPAACMMAGPGAHHPQPRPAGKQALSFG